MQACSQTLAHNSSPNGFAVRGSARHSAMLVLGLALAWGTPAAMASAKTGQPTPGAVSSPVSSSATAKADAGKPGLSPRGANDTTSPTSPAAVVGAFAAHFNAGQHDSLMSLYETGAVFVASPGQAVTSTEGIRAATGQFMGLRLPIQIKVRHVFQADDLALVVSDWTIRGKAPSGAAIDLAGTATDVMRRSASGGWRYVIDNPFGGQRPQP